MRSILTALQEGRLFELPEQAEKPRALEFLARILDANPDIEVGTDAIEEIKQREEEYNTGIGLGVAVPHVRARREEGELYCAIGWSAAGIAYGAPDGAPVHLVFMYYIPGAQKNVYLKEISSLVKAIKKTGGIEPIEHASHLNVVRNLLLDWVSEVLGDTGPEAVARMIKLEVKQAQAPTLPMAAPAAVPGFVAPPVAAAPPAVAGAKVLAFSVLAAPPNTYLVLASDADWTAALEKDNSLGQRLMAGGAFTAAGRQIYVTGTTAYPGGRVLYSCVALAPGG
jgi:mannitol/fructose-specific phosphotransferase system IIA component (Ntr-type)